VECAAKGRTTAVLATRCRRVITRSRIAAALVVLCLGLVVVSQSSSRAQDQPEVRRKVLNKLTPVYPELARRARLSGTVKVEAVVSPEGKVKATHVLGGSPVLAQAACDAIGNWRWAPALRKLKN